jgi:hypothetical protein
MMFELLELRRMVSQSDRVGSVHEVKKDKIRVNMGTRPDGSPWLSPWLHTEDHRGFSSDNTGHTQRQVYSVGQSVKVSMNHDHRASTVSPYAESKSQPAPAHADDYLDSKEAPTAETYQNGKLRVTSGHKGDDKKKFHEVWIADEDDKPPAHQEQSGQAGGSSSTTQQTQQQKSKAKPVLKMRISEDGGFTARYQSDMRVSATKDGAKVKAGSNFASATKTNVIVKAASGNAYIHAAGTIYLNKPPILGSAPSDPIKDDNN